MWLSGRGMRSPTPGFREKRRVWLVAMGLGLGLMMAGVPFSEASEPTPSVLQPATDIDQVLQALGVFDQMASVAGMLQSELRALQSSSLFSPGDVSQVRRMLSNLREDQLYEQITAAIGQQFTPDELQQLQALAQRSELRYLSTQEAQLRSPAQQEQLRLYRAQLRESPPAPKRLEWMQALDHARYHSRFETALKVSMRKSVLAAIAMVKTHQPLSEAALEQELRQYRGKLTEELQQQALNNYLYLYRKTPTESVQNTVEIYRDPLYQRLMSVCEQALVQSFRLAREKNEDTVRVAEAIPQ